MAMDNVDKKRQMEPKKSPDSGTKPLKKKMRSWDEDPKVKATREEKDKKRGRFGSKRINPRDGESIGPKGSDQVSNPKKKDKKPYVNPHRTNPQDEKSMGPKNSDQVSNPKKKDAKPHDKDKNQYPDSGRGGDFGIGGSKVRVKPKDPKKGPGAEQKYQATDKPKYEVKG
jgi:hypothetical protein